MLKHELTNTYLKTLQKELTKEVRRQYHNNKYSAYIQSFEVTLYESVASFEFVVSYGYGDNYTNVTLYFNDDTYVTLDYILGMFSQCICEEDSKN